MKVAMTQNTIAHPYEECIKKAGLPMNYDNPNFDDSLYRMKTTSPKPEQVSMYELCKKIQQEKGQGALQSTSGRYKVNKRTNILKFNPNKKDGFGDVGTDIVGTLESGDIIDIAKQGGGGRGAIMTPYLIFSDDTFIIGYNADKVDDSTPLTPKLVSTPNSFLQKNKTNLLLLLAVVVGYFAYKKFKK
jgi:hypothetical protein